MIKPFPTQDADQPRASFARRPILLAKLPHVGVRAAGPIETPAASAEPQLQTIGVPAEETYVHTQRFVDPSHQVSHSQTPSDPIAPPAVPEAEPTAPQTYFRHDATHHPAHHGHTGKSAQPQSTSGLVQMHSAVSSHSGLIVTLALAASAILLLLTIVSPSEPPAQDFREGYEFYGNAPAEVPAFGLNRDKSNVADDEPTAQLAEGDAEELTVSASQSNMEISLPRLNEQSPTPLSVAGERLSAKPSRPLIGSTDSLLLLPTPEAPEPEVDEEPEFDDPSASIYPQSQHPGFDFSVLGVTEENSSVVESPEVASLPTSADATTNR